jgi:hypothetical protein
VSDVSTAVHLSATLNPGAVSYQEPEIRSVSPDPVALFDYRSPATASLIIHGEHFRPDLTVTVSAENWGATLSDDYDPPITYVSDRELRVTFPTKLWYIERVTYRFTVVHRGRQCSADLKIWN